LVIGHWLLVVGRRAFSIVIGLGAFFVLAHPRLRGATVV
jgi:hypothetical protein